MRKRNPTNISALFLNLSSVLQWRFSSVMMWNWIWSLIERLNGCLYFVLRIMNGDQNTICPALLSSESEIPTIGVNNSYCFHR